MEPQQSDEYAQYIRLLGWKAVSLDGVNIFYRQFPLFGGMMKVHRPLKLPNPKKLVSIIKANHIKNLVIEPVENQNQKLLDAWCKTLAKSVTINTTPFLPTKTFRVDLTRNKNTIFGSFSEAKRRAVRRALKLGVIVKKSENINDLIRIKNKSGGLFGFITTTGIKELWNIFHPKNISILLAYARDDDHRPVGGVLLLFWDNIAYYWIAGAIKKGKKLYAPTLLVWEALKESKEHKCRSFDFVGVWDERIPGKNLEWKGFTKFKEGFGGTNIYYPLVIH
ncbi:MAG TPA: peptidoglycan bridge formation glycyltransferase FemA/FemB family protein [Patescibacteria group bacterium]|jgi:hypothetical protein|nr:peptidoglycan bridge formation glycyltransferase FemA/FemB family protein [Patescibacteria group bacterium]